MKKVYLILVWVLTSLAFEVRAEVGASDLVGNLWGKFKCNFDRAAMGPNRDLFVPVNTWHNRLTYDKEKIDEYNEMPWGIGYGQSVYDVDGDWHSVYAMIFKDSNYHPQTIFGYAYLNNWEVNGNPDFKVGAGFTLSLTQRADYAYIPVPLPLPMAGIEYKNFALQAAYVPGGKNDGNVLFSWVKWRF